LKGERAGYNNVFSVNLPKREYFISADSEHDRTLWIDAITAALRTLKDKTSKLKFSSPRSVFSHPL